MKEQSITLKTVDGKAYDIPEGGSLGLLALGYVGVMLWREKRHKIQKEKQKQVISDEKTKSTSYRLGWS